MWRPKSCSPSRSHRPRQPSSALARSLLTRCANPGFPASCAAACRAYPSAGTTDTRIAGLPVGHVWPHALHQVHRRHMHLRRVAGRTHPRPLHEKATRGSSLQLSQRTHAKPCASTPHSRHLVRSRFTYRGKVRRGCPHRLVQHHPLRLPPPVRPPARLYLPRPSHISPGRTLPLGSYEPPWSTVRPGLCLQNVSNAGGDSGRQTGMLGTSPWTRSARTHS